MSKKIRSEHIKSVLSAIEMFPEGASLKEIIATIKAHIPTRTLQRWLSELTLEGKIVFKGHGRGARYTLKSNIDDTGVAASEKTEPYKQNFSLSVAGEKILAEISKPLNQRPLRGYQRSFLDAYRPNVTFYLPNKVRAHLMNLNGDHQEHQASGTQVKRIYNQLLIDLTWNSSRLEGNTYSLLETEHLLREGAVAEGKNIEETQMILNHKAAIEFLVYSAEQIEINRWTIFSLHSLLSENLLANPRSCGRLRSIPVRIGSSNYIPLAIPQVIEECFNQIIDTAKAIQDPFEQAFFLLIQLPYLQPFEDVNKRTSRLAANIPFIRHNLSPISFVEVSEKVYVSGLLGVYELNQIELMIDLFVWAYEKSSALYSISKENMIAFDPFRLQYRSIITETVRRIVLLRMDKATAIHQIQETAKVEFPLGEVKKFIEVVETELLAMHEGNFARFKVSLSEFTEWQKHWK